MTKHSPNLTGMIPPGSPRPVPGCQECARLDAERAEAAYLLDRSAVSDANVLIRGHQARAHG